MSNRLDKLETVGLGLKGVLPLFKEGRGDLPQGILFCHAEPVKAIAHWPHAQWLVEYFDQLAEY